MTVEALLTLLTVLSVITSLLTEGFKKLLDSLNVVYATNILVLCVSVVVGCAGTTIFYLWNDIAWTTLSFICIFLMAVANWLGAMLGYDKVIQAIKQVKKI